MNIKCWSSDDYRKAKMNSHGFLKQQNKTDDIPWQLARDDRKEMADIISKTRDDRDTSHFGDDAFTRWVFHQPAVLH